MTLAAEHLVWLSLSLSAQVQFGFYTTTFMRDRNGWVQLKTNGRPIKCKGFLGKPPITGPTTRFIHSSQRRNTILFPECKQGKFLVLVYLFAIGVGSVDKIRSDTD